MNYKWINIPLVILFGACSKQGEMRQPERPNVILILADDLGYGDLGCYGQEKIKTPYIDTLALQGVRFTQHYSGSTVCAPSRNSLLTGQTTGNSTIRGNSFEGQRIGLRESDVTLGTLFSDAGYHTAIFGKWGLGEYGSGSEPWEKGFDDWLGYLNQKHAHDYYTDSLFNNEGRVDIKENRADREVYTHDLFTQKALSTIADFQDTPFFMFLSYTIPHAEIVVPEAEMDGFNYSFEEIPFEGSDRYPFNPRPRAGYATMISMLDRDVGKIMHLLDSLKIRDNTMIVFSSDNGPEAEGKHGCDPAFFQSTGGLRGVKRSLYEGGIRVPLIINWTGRVPEGITSDHVCASWDLFPTFAELLGSKTNKAIDGESLLPVVFGGQQEISHDTLYWEFLHPELGQLFAVRYQNYKAIFNLDSCSTELFDLDSDPFESHNLYDAYPDVALKLFRMGLEHRSHSEYWNFDRARTSVFERRIEELCQNK